MKLWLALAALVAPVLPAAARQETFESIDLRVISAAEGGRVTVDRGSSDGVAKGDLVVLRPKGGGSFRGTVMRVDERSAVVQMREKDVKVRPGTRGEVLIPTSRVPVAVVPVERPPEPPPPQAGAQEVQEPDEIRWGTEDEGYEKGMPLLAEVRPVRPEERARRISGRFYMSGDATVTTEAGRSNSFVRAGADYLVENPWGKGGGLRLDGELNWRAANDPVEKNVNETNARLDRASYYRGGTRFDPTRWELGRFLQNGMAEFGVLDGWEWTKRRKNNHRYGVSIGYMPDPDPTVEQWEDFQLAAYYSWAVEGNERFTVDGGYQKTWHKGSADRDLLVTNIDYLPLEGWDFQGTAWVDYYDDTDVAKDPGLDLTWVRASAGRRWDSGNGLELTYRHGSFPDIERSEVLPQPTAQELANAFNDRLAVSGWRHLGQSRRLHSEVGAWVDEDDVGGDAELGIEALNLVRDNSADVTAIFTGGRYEWLLGGRFTYGENLSNGRWNAVYEIGLNHRYGFSFDRDDIWQHRLRATRDLTIWGEWNLHLSGSLLLWDSDGAFLLSFYLQRMF